MLAWALGFGAALLLIAAAAIGYRTHRWLIRSVAPAAAVLILGAAVLFVPAQGRDLGSALLDAEAGQRFWFLAALLYWALATWHNARFPLDRAHAQWLAGQKAGTSDTAGGRRRSWTPRLLGGLVFVFALVHLGLAWASGGDADDALRLGALVVLVALLYALLVVFRRPFGRKLQARIATGAPELARRLDAGFSAGSPANRPDQLTRETALSTRLTFAAFFLVGFFLLVWAWGNPVEVGAELGAMALGFVAFGGFLSGLVLLWAITERWGWPLPVAVASLLFIALVVSSTRHYHPVRDCDGAEECLSGTALDGARWSVDEAALAWYRQARELELVAAGEPVPMIFVATAGGGLRAAYWTAVVLGALPEALGFDLERFERHTFAISGVSGGSVGAAFRTALAPEHDDAGALDAAVKDALDYDFLAPLVAALAFVDLPSWVLPEMGQTTRGEALELAFEHAAARDDDAAAAAEDAAPTRLAAPFLSFVPTEAAWRPLLLLNATHQETGRRVIAGHVRIERDPFLDSFDMHELTGTDLPLSTAAHNSARFSYVSPAGRLVEHGTGEDRGHVIDGGYFENFAALTTLQLARAALDAIAADPEGGADAVLPVIIQISSDPGIGGEGPNDAPTRDRADAAELVACGSTTSGFLPHEPSRDEDVFLSGNQVLAPLRGVMGSREAHGVTASKELARFACTRQHADRDPAYAHFAMCETAEPPLGWVLSPGARAAIERYLESCSNPAAMTGLRSAISGEPAATN